jgi:nitrilase
MNEPFLAAAANIAPAFLDREGCLEIARTWITKAAEQNVRLLVFPETWFPGYPVWLDTSPNAALWGHPPAKEIFRKLVENSVQIPSPTTEALCKAAAEARINLVMGLHEVDGGTLYNTMLYISDQGEILGLHRKLVPTYTERLVWGRGDGSTLTAVDTSVGRVGGLVCWEHWMPLARQAMHEKDEIVHAAVWPTVGEVHQLASRAYAFEGRCYVIAAGSVLRRADLPEGFELLDELPGDGPWMSGGSVIIGPDAAILAGPAGDDDELVTAMIDPGRIPEEKMTLDVCGHYSRPDVFQFEVKGEVTSSPPKNR